MEPINEKENINELFYKAKDTPFNLRLLNMNSILELINLTEMNALADPHCLYCINKQNLYCKFTKENFSPSYSENYLLNLMKTNKFFNVKKISKKDKKFISIFKRGSMSYEDSTYKPFGRSMFLIVFNYYYIEDLSLLMYLSHETIFNPLPLMDSSFFNTASLNIFKIMNKRFAVKYFDLKNLFISSEIDITYIPKKEDN